MKQLLSLTFLLLLYAPSMVAQRKELSQARSLIKSSKRLDTAAKKMDNYKKAEEIVNGLLKDSANRQDPKIYLLWYETVKKQYETANQQLYLKQKYDTVAFFNLAKKMFSIIESVDSMEVANDNGKATSKVHAKYAEELLSLRPNLYFGGAFFVRKSQFENAYAFFDTYLNCVNLPIFASNNFSTDKHMADAAYWATYSAYRLGDGKLALKHADRAIADSAKSKYAMQYKAEALLKTKSDSAYYNTLLSGFDKFIDYPYFFTRLIDYYTQRKDYDKALALTDKALEADSHSILVLFTRSTLLLNTGKYDESIAVGDSIIAINDSLAEPYYNIGTAYLNKAMELENSTNYRNDKTKLKKNYSMACIYLEKYRKLAPDASSKWAPPLYKIYLNLNMGKQFDEIDKILNGK